MANKNNEDIYCSFCGKPQEMASRLIAGNGSIFVTGVLSSA